MTSREVIAIDLIEYLSAQGAQVDLLRALYGLAPEGHGLAIVDYVETHGPGDFRLDALRRAGARVIVFHNGNGDSFAEHGVIPLRMPFTSRDLDRLFARYNIVLGARSDTKHG